jgi:hypothetical protein
LRLKTFFKVRVVREQIAAQAKMPATRLVNGAPDRTAAPFRMADRSARPPCSEDSPAAGSLPARRPEDRRLGFRRSVALVMPQAAQHCGITRAMRDMTRGLLSKHASFQEAFLKYGGTVIFLPH